MPITVSVQYNLIQFYSTRAIQLIFSSAMTFTRWQYFTLFWGCLINVNFRLHTCACTCTVIKKLSGFDYHLHKMKFTISQIYARPISFVQCNVQTYNQTRLLAIKKCWCLVIPNEPQNNKLSTIITPITKKRSVFIFVLYSKVSSHSASIFLLPEYSSKNNTHQMSNVCPFLSSIFISLKIFIYHVCNKQNAHTLV